MCISTRSRIGIIKKDGSIESVYCHFDGYLDGVGKMLKNNYQDINKIKELIKLGDISCLREEVNPDASINHSFDSPQENVTVAYYRDRNENYNDTKSNIEEDLNKFNESLINSWIEYVYLFDEKSNKWFWDYYSFDSNSLALKPLDEYFLDNQKDQIAIKSGYYFMIFKKNDVSFVNELKELEKQVKVDGVVYNLYEAPNWDIAQKVDALMGNDKLGLDIDEFEFKDNKKLERSSVMDGKEKPKAQIIGADGNVFNLMGICSRALKNAGYRDESNEMINRITNSKSYDEALAIMCEYIDPVSKDYEDIDSFDNYDDGHIGI